MTHDAFLCVLSCMDINMAVSLTESFNICTADSVMCNVPVVVSKEIRWVNPKLHADATDVDSIVRTMERSVGIGKHYFLHDNKKRLRAYNEVSRKTWLKVLKPMCTVAR